MSNLSSDYEGVIREGLLARRESVDAYGQRIIDALLGLTDRYRAEALRQGKTDLAAILEHVPRYGAVHFREALQSFRILHFGLWLEGDYHNTIGRFDKIMYPYLKADMEQGLYSEESALELVKDFFLSFNKDSDLYPGVQQGNNGQSMMLFTQKIFINQFSLQSLQATGHLTCPGSPVLACFLPGSALSQSLQQFGYAVPDPERTYSREPVLWNPSHLLMPHSKHSR